MSGTWNSNWMKFAIKKKWRSVHNQNKDNRFLDTFNQDVAIYPHPISEANGV